MFLTIYLFLGAVAFFLGVYKWDTAPEADGDIDAPSILFAAFLFALVGAPLLICILIKRGYLELKKRF